MDNEFYKKEIRARLGDRRYEHSLNVADSAVHLAEKYGGNAEKAYTAGLLHDILKEMPKDEMLAFIKAHTDVTEAEESCSNVWHQMADAYFVADNYFDDADIFNAIRYHTTARAGMSLLEKIIYVADFISAERDYPDVGVMRSLAEKSLGDAMLYALKYTIKSLCDRGLPLHPDTAAAYNELILKGYDNA